MPITFEGPAPIGAIVNLRRNTGGFGGGGLADQYAAAAAQQRSNAEQAQLMQQDRFHQDNQLEQQQQFAASRDFSVRDAGMANAAMAQEQQRVGLQIQRNQAELTQGENLRLQRLKQGQEDVQKQLDSGAISGEEANVMWSQLATGINPMEIRKAKSQLAHQDMQNEGIKAHMKLELQRSENLGKQEEARLAFSNAQADGKVKYIVNAASAAALKQQWADDFKDRPPEELAAAIQEELMARGDYKTHYIAKDGTLVEAKLQDNPMGGEPGTHGPGRAGASGSGTGASRGHGHEPQFDPTHAMDKAIAAVQKGLSDGTIKPEEADAKREAYYAMYEKAHDDRTNKQAAEKVANKPAPFDARNPSSGTPQQRTQIDAIEQERRSLPANAPPEVQVAVSRAVDEKMRLVSKWGNDKGAIGRGPETPSWVHKRLAEINAIIDHAKAQTYPAQKTDGSMELTPENKALADHLAAKHAWRLASGAQLPEPPPGAAAAPAPAPAGPELGRGLLPDAGTLNNRFWKYWGKQLPSKEQMRQSTPDELRRLGDYIRTY